MHDRMDLDNNALVSPHEQENDNNRNVPGPRLHNKLLVIKMKRTMGKHVPGTENISMCLTASYDDRGRRE